jgi:hypothetical protein
MQLLPPIRLELKAWGSRWGDVVFGVGDQILISNMLKDLFVEAGLVDFARLDPVEMVKISRRKKRVGRHLTTCWLRSSAVGHRLTSRHLVSCEMSRRRV